jgi:amidohydrolase
MGAGYSLKYSQGYPPLVNSEFMAGIVSQCAGEVVGLKNVVEPEPTMGGEDMAFFLEQSQGCFFFLGVGVEGCAGVHNPKFNVNEKNLLTGIEIYANVALNLLGA